MVKETISMPPHLVKNKEEIKINIGDIVWWHDYRTTDNYNKKMWGYVTKINKKLIEVITFENNKLEVLFFFSKGDFWDNE
jgi:hypothetical protein